MSKDITENIVITLREYSDIFAYTSEDMPGLNLVMAEHHLNICPQARPVQQRLRPFNKDKVDIIKNEVEKLLKAGQIEIFKYPEWLSNVVIVPKPGGKWRMCIDFRNLNDACPKNFYGKV